jgi:hypothetical protein
MARHRFHRLERAGDRTGTAMSLAAGDIGLVGHPGQGALGVFRDDGSHNPDWFGNPQR